MDTHTCESKVYYIYINKYIYNRISCPTLERRQNVCAYFSLK